MQEPDMAQKHRNAHEIRRQNLALLVEQFKTELALARRIGHTSGSLLNQIKSGTRDCGEKLARTIESKLDLPRGWLDSESHAAAAPTIVDAALMEEVIAAVHATLPPKTTAARFAALVTVLYGDAVEGVAPTPDRVLRLLKLSS
jgi:hypothetical protein